MNGNHKDTKDKYDPNGFDINENHKDTGYRYNLNDFDIKGIHRDTKDKYNPEGYDIKGIHKDTKNKYNPEGYDMKGIHKDTKTFFDKEKFIRKDLFNDLNWLENKDECLKLYDKIIKEEEFTVTVNKKVISSKIFKDFIEDILSGKINNNNKKEIYKKKLDGVENDLAKSKKSKNINQLKDYLIKIKDLTGMKDCIKDPKGKGYVGLPILLSKMYTNNNSKELKTNIKNLLNQLLINK